MINKGDTVYIASTHVVDDFCVACIERTVREVLAWDEGVPLYSVGRKGDEDDMTTEYHNCYVFADRESAVAVGKALIEKRIAFEAEQFAQEISRLTKAKYSA